MQEYVDIGWVTRPRGLRGEVWVTPYSDDPDRLLELREFQLAEPDGSRTLRLRSGIRQSGRLALLFEGFSTCEEAQAICGRLLRIHRRDLPPLDDDEVFLADLIGLEARLESGWVVGRVRDVLELPTGAVLEIARDSAEALVPFQRRFVPKLDLPGGWLTLDVPEGMIPESMLPAAGPAPIDFSESTGP